MGVKKCLPVWCLLTPLLLAACGDVKDEATVAGRDASSFPAASENYFKGMDDDDHVILTPEDVKGRNTWMVWTGGNDRFWDYFAKHSFGTFDLLKVLSSGRYSGFCLEKLETYPYQAGADRSPAKRKCKNDGGHWYVDNDYTEFCGVRLEGAGHSRRSKDSCPDGYEWYSMGRSNRWKWYGVVNEPCFEQAKGPDEKYGLYLDRRKADCPQDPFANEEKYPGVKIGARGKTVPVGSYYGEPSVFVGLRLFPNPDFDEEAKRKWDPVRYYTDPAYYKDPKLVRPYRVGMSCGFCHVGPKPTLKQIYGTRECRDSEKKEECYDPESPKWRDLSSIVGAQYMWIDRIFSWESDWSNFLYQLENTFRPGTLDTSIISTDYIANPRTMNAFYEFCPRLKLSLRWGKAKLAGEELRNPQLRPYDEMPDTVWTPRILKDGSDSVGALGSLNRVYLNIGVFSEEWLRHFDFLLGLWPISPISIADADKNSAYWRATVKQTGAMAYFLMKVGAPHHLKKEEASEVDTNAACSSENAHSSEKVPVQSVGRAEAERPCGKAYAKGEYPVEERGKLVFADRCARCHSSKIPRPAGVLDSGKGCAGRNYVKCWNAYWRWTKTDEFRCEMRKMVRQKDFLKGNYLSTDLRVPVTLLETNACSPLATNAIAGNIWDNFSSQSYKQLPSVGSITIHDPFTGEKRLYTMPAGGRGYTRVPSLVSVWSTAPLLLNNSLGPFPDARVSIEDRVCAFDAAMDRLLSPEKRDKDPILGRQVPGVIDRTTVDSYVEIPPGGWGRWLLRQVCPAKVDNQGFLRLGPIPKNTPIGVISNIEIWPDRANLAQSLWHLAKLAPPALRMLGALCWGNPTEKDFNEVLRPLLKFDKCPDLVVNKGHYFGTDKFTEEEGLSNDEKKDLIEFLKTF
jgi:hypothetical protein